MPAEPPGGILPPIEEYVTTYTYDIQGNVLNIMDPLERTAFEYVYDLANRKLRIKSIDAGIKQVVIGVMGNSLESEIQKMR